MKTPSGEVCPKSSFGDEGCPHEWAAVLIVVIEIDESGEEVASQCQPREIVRHAFRAELHLLDRNAWVVECQMVTGITRGWQRKVGSGRVGRRNRVLELARDWVRGCRVVECGA